MRKQVLDHSATLGPVGIHESVPDDDETIWLERFENCPIQLALLVMRGDVMEGERSDDGMAAGELIIEARQPHFTPTGVRSAPRSGDFQHVRIDVDELGSYLRESIENRG
jgi:hypothetical protein